jgi:DNA-binding FrmR family transcriptional regulator
VHRTNPFTISSYSHDYEVNNVFQQIKAIVKGALNSIPNEVLKLGMANVYNEEVLVKLFDWNAVQLKTKLQQKMLSY